MLIQHDFKVVIHSTLIAADFLLRNSFMNIYIEITRKDMMNQGKSCITNMKNMLLIEFYELNTAKFSI